MPTEALGQIGHIALWVGTAGMALGTAIFLWLGREIENKEFVVVTVFITLVAAASYLSMALGFSVTELIMQNGETKTIFWGRYVDWVITTPLLLVDLALLANVDRNTLFTLIGLDVFMIVTGLVATLSNVTGHRYIWWGVSTGALVVLLYFLFVILDERAEKQPGDVGSLFATLRNITVVLWLAYPILWLVGTEGLGVVGLGVETAAFMVLDLAAKVGFGILLLKSRETLNVIEFYSGRDEEVGGGEAATAD
ncbi:MAG: bacteriorhodopsin [Halobacteria archaeon]|nr:bacteriorhodopsin [Halobacteria archaeon]